MADGTSRKDLIPARNQVSVLRPGAVQPRDEDDFEVDYVFGEDATAEDIQERTLAKLVAQVSEGENGAVLCFGATGTGKTHTLQGRLREGAAAVLQGFDGPEGKAFFFEEHDQLPRPTPF